MLGRIDMSITGQLLGLSTKEWHLDMLIFPFNVLMIFPFRDNLKHLWNIESNITVFEKNKVVFEKIRSKNNVRNIFYDLA